MRPSLEVADIFARFGGAYRQAHKGHLNLSQLKVMSAIVSCRTAVLGGHVEGCTKCDHTKIAYNSCRNRHCPKCQGAAARDWLAKRQEDLLPVGSFHVVFTLPHEIGDIAWYNKTVIYDLLFKAASQTLMTIAADPRHLGARIGITAVLHTCSSHPSSPHSYDRTRGWPQQRWQALDPIKGEVPSARACLVQAISALVLGQADGPTS